MHVSRRELINALYEGRNTLGAKLKKAFHGLFGSTYNVIFGTKSSIQEKLQVSDNADCLNMLGEVC